MDWYPQQEKALTALLEKFLEKSPKNREIHGIIVPHAGYVYSGKIAGKSFSYLKNLNSKKAIILAPSHYTSLKGIAKHNQQHWKTPLGKIALSKTSIPAKEINLEREHAIDNQIPFLQKLGFKEVLPIMVGSITSQEAEEIAETLSKQDAVFIVSADMSHFLEYDKAIIADSQTIKTITSLNTNKKEQIDSCGIFPLLIAMNVCKINNWKPKLIEYKNSGDVTEDKSSVVGYAGLYF